MIDRTPPIKREYVQPKVVETIVPEDGTEWRCEACGVDLFGKFRDGELHIKYSARNIFITYGELRIRCRKCYFENILNMGDIFVNVLSFNENDSTRVTATEKAHELAEKHKVDLRFVQGSGADGQIIVADIKKLIP